MSAAPLAGLKVLDLSKVLAGPLCAQFLGDMGADAIHYSSLQFTNVHQNLNQFSRVHYNS